MDPAVAGYGITANYLDGIKSRIPTAFKDIDRRAMVFVAKTWLNSPPPLLKAAKITNTSSPWKGGGGAPVPPMAKKWRAWARGG